MPSQKLENVIITLKSKRITVRSLLHHFAITVSSLFLSNGLVSPADAFSHFKCIAKDKNLINDNSKQ
jgi:hypothetical protein